MISFVCFVVLSLLLPKGHDSERIGAFVPHLSLHLALGLVLMLLVPISSYLIGRKRGKSKSSSSPEDSASGQKGN